MQTSTNVDHVVAQDGFRFREPRQELVNQDLAQTFTMTVKVRATPIAARGAPRSVRPAVLQIQLLVVPPIKAARPHCNWYLRGT